jgi:hypothetical protein
MSTRANIELYDGWKRDNGRVTEWRKGVLLYHHCDGYPSWMGPELERKLKKAKEELEKAGFPYWWDSERVGALIVKLSANESELHKNVPTFQPCLQLHGDIEYLWRIFLGPEDGDYHIQCFSIARHWEKDEVEYLKEVNWREKAGL